MNIDQNIEQNQSVAIFNREQANCEPFAQNYVLLYNPYTSCLPLMYLNQNGQSFQAFKATQQCGVQTEEMELKNASSQQEAESNSQNGQFQSNQFPLPNKEKLYQLFQCKSNKKKDIQEIINELCSDKTRTLNNYYKSIGEKIINFKKTKQQVIKFLIRRAWKKQGQGLNQARQKYYSGYKSMNSDYLKVIFKDSSFVEAYQKILDNFNSDFQSFNQRRFNRFYQYFLHCYINNSLGLFKTSKQCKSKLPYPHFWKIQIEQIAHSLYDTYYESSSIKRKTSSNSNVEKKKKQSNQ